MSKYESFESYNGTIKKGNKIVKENVFIVYDDIHDRFLSHFRKDNDVTKLSSLGSNFDLVWDREVLSPEEISKREKIIEEESLPYGTNLEGYYVDEDSIVLVSSNKKGRR